MNSPIMSGNRNSITIPSNLNWYEKEVKPIQNSFSSNFSFFETSSISPVIAASPPTRIIAPVDIVRIIFLFLEMSALKIKYNDNGKNIIVNAFEGIESRYAIGESGQNLYTKYKDSK